MVPKKLARFVLVCFLCVAIAIIYVTLFKHPPPEKLMKMNGAGVMGKDFGLQGFLRSGRGHKAHTRELTDDEDEEEEVDEKDEVESSFFAMAPSDDEDDNDDDADDGDKEEEEEEKKVEDKKKKRRKVLDDKDTAVADHAGDADDDRDDHAGDNDGDHDDDDDGKRKSKRNHVDVHRGKKTKEAREKETSQLKGTAVWNKFNKVNGHTVIGIVFDSCDEPKVQLGTVVMLPDQKNGGVMSRTFYNFTLDRVIDEGWTFNIEVKYNDQDLYDNWWEVCEMEEDLEVEERTFICPIKPGKVSLVKDKHIPGYLPKGHYVTKAWVKDDKEKVAVCGISDFKL